jgi:flagellar hook protein FlgE
LIRYEDVGGTVPNRGNHQERVTMISAYQPALSALQAFGKGINANANNIANSTTEGYKRTRVTYAAAQPQGVQATAEQDKSQGPVVSQGTTGGIEYTELSNVDLSNELTDFTMNADYYKANLKTLQASDQMTKTLLDIKA